MTIEFKNLTFRYGKKSPDALSGFTATVAPGIHLLLGENGAGKTTLLHLIDGLLFPTSGRCAIDGARTSLRLPSILSRVFFAGPTTPLPAKNVDELVRNHAQFYPRFSAELLADNLAQFGVSPAAPFKSLSMGSRQKAMVAYALALRTEVLLLDEPATGLDIDSKQMLQKMIAASVDESQTVIVSTHNIADLERLYDGVIVLNRGRLMLAATVDDVLSRVAFVRSARRPDGALYCEEGLGGCQAIVGAGAGVPESDIDFRLLYAALHQPDCSELLKMLNAR